MTTPSPFDPTAIFQLDPTTLTDTDLTALVSELRRRRSEFAASEAAKAATPKSKRTKVDSSAKSAPTAAALDKPAADLSLSDLL